MSCREIHTRRVLAGARSISQYARGATRRAKRSTAVAQRLPAREPAVVTPMGPVLAVHVGTGAVAVCFELADPTRALGGREAPVSAQISASHPTKLQISSLRPRFEAEHDPSQVLRTQAASSPVASPCDRCSDGDGAMATTKRLLINKRSLIVSTCGESGERRNGERRQQF